MREIRYILLGLSVLLAACNKEDRDPTTSYGSGQIGFEATTGDVSTKTEYSHTWTSGSSPSAGNSREFIDWIAGDVLRIYCKEADGSLDGNNPVSADPSNNYCADYRVTANTRASSSNNTRASIEPFTSNPYGNGGYAGLQWGDANTKHHLYAVYPSPGQGNAKDRDGNTVKDPSGNNLSSMPITAGWHTASSAQAVFSRINQLLGNDASRIVGSFYVKGSLPSAQQGFWSQDAGSAGDQSASNSAKRHFRPNMNYAAMVAYSRSLPKTDGSKVVLGFEPVFTALEFQIVGKKDDLLDSDLASAELSSATSDLCGEFVTTFVPVLSQNEQDVYVETGSRNDTGNGWRGPNGDRTLIYRTVCTGAATNSKKVSISFAKDSEADGHANGRRLVEYNPANPSTYNPITFTFLVLPQAYDNNHPLNGQYTSGTYTPSEVTTQLTLTLRFKNGETRSLELRYDLNNDGTVAEDEWIGVKMYKKSYFKNMQVPGEIQEEWEWEYVLDVEGPASPMNAGNANTTYSVRSYKYHIDKQGTRHEVPVPWKTQINLGSRTDENQADWRDIASYTPNNDRMPGGWIIFNNTANGDGRTLSSGQKETRTVQAQEKRITISGSNPESYHQAALGGRLHPSGINNLYSKDNAIDLSMYDIQGNPSSRNTANCYVVHGPGWYKIPLVYGNGFKNGEKNVSGSENFVDHAGKTINRPWIQPQTGIAYANMTGTVVWTDFWDSTKERGIVCDVQVVGEYLVFRIPQDTIRPGNSVIAVKNGNNILWSWHIWVTEQDLRADTNGYLTANVGWVDLNVKDGAYYPARGEMLRIVQVEEGGLTENFAVQQKGQDFYSDKTFSYGKYTYFQWGRKDPIIASESKGSAVNNPVWGPDGTKLINNNNSSLDYFGYATTFTESRQTILNPMTMHLSLGGPILPGGWSQDEKTLYDPSPVGFRVMPNATDFMSRYRSTSNPGSLNDDGDRRTWYPGRYMFDGFFLSACGYRNGRSDGGANQPSALVAPAGVSNDNDVRLSRATFWTASGPIIIRFQWGQGMYIVNDGNPNGADAEWANAHAIRPVLE